MFQSVINTFLSVAISFTTSVTPVNTSSEGVKRVPTTPTGIEQSLGVKRTSYPAPKKDVLTYIPPLFGGSGVVIDKNVEDTLNSLIIEQNFYSIDVDLITEEEISPLDQQADLGRNDKLSDSYYANLLDETDLDISLGSDFAPNTYDPTDEEINHCKSILYQTYNSLPEDHTDNLQELVLYFSDEGRRGYGGSDKIIMRCSNVDDSELAGVFTHEMGHIVDIGQNVGSVLAGKSDFMDGSVPIYNNDLSLDFYQISWQDESTNKEGTDRLDFVTGYAMTDPFEDFAESYIFYILQGDSFREMTEYNDKINQKYEYLKNVIFNGEEFDFSDPLDNLVLYREFDSTILEYDFDEFLGQ